MDLDESYFLSYNKLLEEKIDSCVHNIEVRLDRLFERKLDLGPNNQAIAKITGPTKIYNPLSNSTFSSFKAPYIKDFRNFSGPSNVDVQQIQNLNGTENIDFLIKNKSWSRESKKQLIDAVFDHYAQLHMIDLIKQKNILTKQTKDASPQQLDDLQQKLDLIEEQTEQVRSRREPRIFVPETRNDPTIDWCAISAKLANTNHDATDCRLMWSNKLHLMINSGVWTREEDICLLNAVKKVGKNNWDSVADELNSNRLPWQCCSRYNQEFASARYGSKQLSDDDMEKIVEVVNLCRIGDFVPWNQVMYFIQFHSLSQVKYQWQKLISDRKSNQLWSHEEDILLLSSIERFGEKDWLRISNGIPGRSNKSCRERYTMRLKFPMRALGNWTSKEDENLLSLTDRFGPNWSLISSLFSDRNCHQLRSRYELLKNDPGRVGPIKRKKLYKNHEGLLVLMNGRRPKPSSEREVDDKLGDIFATYQTIKSPNRSLICRSVQDEILYQNLIKVLGAIIIGRESDPNLLSDITTMAIKQTVISKYDLFPPCVASLKGYRAWTLYQDYLSQSDYSKYDLAAITATQEYYQLLKIIMSLFLWPAILVRVSRPSIDTNSLQLGGIIEKDTKNLYKVREIQKQVILNSCNK